MASSRPKALLAKIETVPGTDSVPVVGTDAVKLLDEVSVSMDMDYAPLNFARDYIGTDTELAVGTRLKVSCKVAAASSGTLGTAPHYDVLMRICGMRKLVTASTKVEYFDDSDSAFESATIYYYFGGKLHKLLYAMGTWDLVMGKGGIPTLAFELTGLYGGITDVTNGTLVFANCPNPVPVNKANTSVPTLHSYNATMYDLKVGVGNKVVHTTVPGVEDIDITDRERTGSITIRDVLIATKDFPTIVRNATVGGLSVQHGQTATNIFEVVCTDVQLKNPKYGDVDMTITTGFDLRIQRTAKANAGIKLICR